MATGSASKRTVLTEESCQTGPLLRRGPSRCRS
jgi:hypothetical protein